MNSLICSCQMPLGFNILEVLLHMFNLALLIVGMRFLIYKPVKKFIDKRKASIKEQEDNAKNAMDEATAIKEKYEKAMETAENDGKELAKRKVDEADVMAQGIISNAKEEAKGIIDKANKDAEKSREIAGKKLASSVSELAVNMAQGILGREVKKEDNDAVIDSILNEWSKNEEDNR